MTAATHTPFTPSLVTRDDLGFDPFTPEEIAENAERGETLATRIYEVGERPTLMDCASVLGNLAGIAQQQTLEIAHLRAELARSKSGLGRYPAEEGAQ